MSELSPETRRLLDEARDAHSPPAGARARMRAKIDPALMAEPPPPVRPTSTLARLGASNAVRALFVVALLAVAALVWRRATRPGAEVTTPVAQRSIPRELPAPPAVAVADVPPPPVDVQPAVPAPVATDAGRASETRPSPANTAPRDDLAAELALVRRAQQSLGAGRPSEALAATVEHQRRFAARGALLEEVWALRSVSLCTLGRRDEGIAWARRLEGRFPRSPHLARVRTACEASPR